MRKKNNYPFIGLCCLLMALSSCIDDFLDKPAHNMTPELEMNDMVRLSSSVYYMVTSMPQDAGAALYAMGELASDNALRGSILTDMGGLDRNHQYNQFQNFEGISPTSEQYIEGLWNRLYPGVDQANVNLRALDRLFPDGNAQLREALKAENRFMRAWFYLQLVNTFGEVVIIPEKEITPAEYAGLENNHTICQLFDTLMVDLRHAVQTLPTKEEWKKKFNIEWQGRAHLGSAKGYLTKALLFQAANELYFNKSTAKAEAAYREIVSIVNSMYNEYTLADDYEQLFRPAGNYSVESLFEIGTASTSDGKTSFAGWRPVQPRLYTGYGQIAPSLNLINQYERDAKGAIVDKRYAGTILFGGQVLLSGMVHPGDKSPLRLVNGDLITGAVAPGVKQSSWPNRYSRKAVQPKPVPTANSPETNLGGANLKFLRWAEVLLIGAEAACHIGDEIQARSWLKEIRRRAGLDENKVDALNGEELLLQIWKDKRLEIALEWSNRYFELVRIDKIHPGYMRNAFQQKVDEEFAGIRTYLDEKNLWKKVYSNDFPLTTSNLEQMLPLCNGLSLPKHYTLPISSKIFNKMTKVRQTRYYR